MDGAPRVTDGDRGAQRDTDGYKGVGAGVGNACTLRATEHNPMANAHKVASAKTNNDPKLHTAVIGELDRRAG